LNDSIPAASCAEPRSLSCENITGRFSTLQPSGQMAERDMQSRNVSINATAAAAAAIKFGAARSSRPSIFGH
jgi:hypothetical protein